MITSPAYDSDRSTVGMTACTYHNAQECKYWIQPNTVWLWMCEHSSEGIPFKFMSGFDAFVEFTGPKAKKHFFFTFFLNILLSTRVVLHKHKHASNLQNLVFFQHNYHCKHCKVYVQSYFHVKIEGFMKIMCRVCVHGMVRRGYGLSLVVQWWSAQKCVGHYTHIKPSPAAF